QPHELLASEPIRRVTTGDLRIEGGREAARRRRRGGSVSLGDADVVSVGPAWALEAPLASVGSMESSMRAVLPSRSRAPRRVPARRPA
ncbi:hypothetical protein ACWD4B_30985, partial [Streptomyces sp. NPDC002536]